MMSDINELKKDIFHRAETFIEKIGEFAPFGAKSANGVIKDVVYQTDETVEVASANAISLLKKKLRRGDKRRSYTGGSHRI